MTSKYGPALKGLTEIVHRILIFHRYLNMSMYDMQLPASTKNQRRNSAVCPMRSVSQKLRLIWNVLEDPRIHLWLTSIVLFSEKENLRRTSFGILSNCTHCTILRCLVGLHGIIAIIYIEEENCYDLWKYNHFEHCNSNNLRCVIYRPILQYRIVSRG